MKIIYALFFILIFSASCNNSAKDSSKAEFSNDSADSIAKKPSSFFPLTNFIRGQMVDIKDKGLNPLKITTADNKSDSVWLKVENMSSEFADFLTPEIDSSSLAGNFKETSFMDQTLNELTFTYDPVKALPDSFTLQHFDVYVDPNKGNVKRIYMIKKLPGNKQTQLTWLAGKSCKIVHISRDQKGNDFVEKEVNINWDF